MSEWSSRSNCSVAECFSEKSSRCRNEQILVCVSHSMPHITMIHKSLPIVCYAACQPAVIRTETPSFKTLGNQE